MTCRAGVFRGRVMCALAASFLIGTVADRAAHGQDKQSPKAKTGRAVQERPQSFEAKFWDFLQSVQYHNWAPAPKQGLAPHPGNRPHGSYLLLYMNRIAASDPKNPPHGSIIVQEDLGKDKKKLLAVTVMYRFKGFDPEHNDWYWMKYNADGTVARSGAASGNKPLAGKVKSCIDCHARAKGGDFYYTNDK